MVVKIGAQSLALLVALTFVNGQYTATYDPNNLPGTTEQGQTGTNACGTGNNQTSQCQNLYVNSAEDFCLWGPPDPNSSVGTVEEIVVAYCTTPGRGTRLFPAGTLISAHFLETPDYIQVTGTGQLTNINIAAGDSGGELDPHGADGFGNPHGGLVFSNVWSGKTGLGQQIHEWTNFMSDTEYCIRVCKDGPNAAAFCQHIYDIQGCHFNIPGDYDAGFDDCKGDNVIPMGLYPQPDGSTSTYVNGANPTPAPQPPAATSSCTPLTSSVIYNGAPAATGSASGSGSVTTAPSGTRSAGGGTTSSPRSTSSSSPNGAAGFHGAPLSLLLSLLAVTISIGFVF
ncbi:hypothetical protein M408DRAFT_328507 [Serendipita vermifera MAFF 305830]|uniref:Carbohydrate-binding module family 13 protein n=1 Tax=Serendipita vermifera MAFF 305830 TaxID=933852 RepID=A0A0C3BDD8_SERVB|nr:hypothetical protein M408DRAFT_328507 [Serendipita vermifera MAFF 305830]